MVDKCSMADLIGTKQSFTSILDTKVDVKEVQNALNDCQSDLG
jgi:hypothetical protein